MESDVGLVAAPQFQKHKVFQEGRAWAMVSPLVLIWRVCDKEKEDRSKRKTCVFIY